MLERYLRPVYQWFFVYPFLRLLSKFHFITPNLITLIGLAFGIAAALAVLISPILAAVLLLLSGYFDTLDGSLARVKNAMSERGTVLDIVCDRVVEICIMLALFAVDPMHRAWSCLLMLSSVLLCITTFLVVGIFTDNKTSEDNHVATNKSFHYSRGLMERPEAFVFFILMILIPAQFLLLSSIFSVLVFYTAVKRLKDFWDNFSKIKSNPIK